jgi:hypothetical protein
MKLASHRHARYSFETEDFFFEVRHHVQGQQNLGSNRVEKDLYEARLPAHEGRYPNHEGQRIKWDVQRSQDFTNEQEA